MRSVSETHTLRAVVLAALALLGMAATSVWAQGVPVPDVVQVATPDGGLAVTLGAQRVSVEATGPGGDPVAIFGSVNATLTPATIAALGPPICTVAEAHRHNLGTSPEILPVPLADGGTGVIPGRTSWTVFNVDTTDIKTIACRVDPGDGGLPDCAIPGFGLTVFPNGGSLTFPVRDNETVRCIACTAATTIEHTEEACEQP